MLGWLVTLLWLLPLVFVLTVVGYFVFAIKKIKSRYGQHPKSASSVVLITGCDSGIGRASSEKFLKEGYHVIATVFTETGEGSLKDFASSIGKPDNLSVTRADITNEESVRNLLNFVSSVINNSDKKLIGLVNNAGISLPSPFEVQPLIDFKRQIEVNLFGHVHVSQVFLPLLRESKGRIVNITSAAGRFATPGMAAYAASKFALEAVTSVQRQELSKWGISVSSIEPGFMRTPLVVGTFTDLQAQSILPNAKELYGDLYDRTKKTGERILSYAASPAGVAEKVYHAVNSHSPKTRYIVGKDAHILVNLSVILPDRALELLLDLLL